MKGGNCLGCLECKGCFWWAATAAAAVAVGSALADGWWPPADMEQELNGICESEFCYSTFALARAFCIPIQSCNHHRPYISPLWGLLFAGIFAKIKSIYVLTCFLFAYWRGNWFHPDMYIYCIWILRDFLDWPAHKEGLLFLETSPVTPRWSSFLSWFREWINLLLIGQAIIPITQAQLHSWEIDGSRSKKKLEIRNAKCDPPESTATIWVIQCKLFFLLFCQRPSPADKLKLTSSTSSQFINISI